MIDVFAGPGGLGEDFSRLQVGGDQAFHSALSIEEDATAHRTLTLRAFYRQFDAGHAPDAYFDHMRAIDAPCDSPRL
ncbi:MAG: hypothetical protein ACT4PG_08870 [Panacagrimonas sp.]